jgi:hypothetical protein
MNQLLSNFSFLTIKQNPFALILSLRTICGSLRGWWVMKNSGGMSSSVTTDGGQITRVECMCWRAQVWSSDPALGNLVSDVHKVMTILILICLFWFGWTWHKWLSLWSVFVKCFQYVSVWTDWTHIHPTWYIVFLPAELDGSYLKIYYSLFVFVYRGIYQMNWKKKDLQRCWGKLVRYICWKTSYFHGCFWLAHLGVSANA